MATHTSPRRMTYEQFATMPDDGKRYELVDGEPVVTPAPTTRHQVLASNLEFALRQAADLAAGALVMREVDVKFTPFRATRPDIVYVSAPRRPRIARTCVDGPPDLVIEVLSPGTSKTDLGRKLAWYAEHGVPEYWVVHSKQQKVQIFRQPGPDGYGSSETLGEDDTLTTPLLLNLAVRVADLYVGLPS